MKTFKILGLPIVFLIIITISVPFQSCEPCEDEKCDTCEMVYKPNIYLYPTTNTQLQVTLDFPQGGEVVTSIPAYNSGWNVMVDTNGLIDDTYTYLFYESTQPNIWQRKQGWSVPQGELEGFFRKNMEEYGFYGHEIDDYIEYWIPRLTSSKCYLIYPQTKEIIDDVIELSIVDAPERVLRLFYVIQGTDSLTSGIHEPKITPFERRGFYVTEWGVVLDSE